MPSSSGREPSGAVSGVWTVRCTRILRNRSRPEVAGLLADRGEEAPSAPVIDIAFRLDGAELRFFSVVSTVGTTVDVTAQEALLEALFPSNDATRAAWQRLASGQ